MTMEITVPDDCMGDVIGDLNSRRGKVLGMESKGKRQIVRAMVPLVEVLKYAPELRAMTAGRGMFTMSFSLTTKKFLHSFRKRSSKRAKQEEK